MANVPSLRGSGWRAGFLFVGNQLALDFLNTCPVQEGRPLELFPDFSAVLRWFQAAGLISAHQQGDLEHKWGNSLRARCVTRVMRKLREKLRQAILSWEQDGIVPGRTTSELNQLMAEHPMLTRLKQGTKKSNTAPWFKLREPEDLFAPLAHSAAMLFAEVDRKRVRKCGQCVLHFYDTSKKGTRRWCSMQLCGNRIKVAAYVARQRRRALR